MYATIDGYDPETHQATDASRSILDRWVLSRLDRTIGIVSQSLDAYDVISSTSAIDALVSDISNWYVRLSRRRFWRGGMSPDKIAAYATLREVLVELAKLLAPFVPFLADAVYRQLRSSGDPASVHLCDYPETHEDRVNPELEEQMTWVRQAVALGHQARNQAQIKVRQPRVRAIIERKGEQALSESLLDLIRTELNVETVEILATLDDLFEETPGPNFRTLGPRLGSLGPKAAEWIRRQDAGELRERAASGTIEIELDGRPVELQPEDILYDKTMPVHLVLSEEAGTRLVLDTSLDERLRIKGLVRELTHRIQLARKNADFDVTDRVALSYRADDRLKQLIESYRDEIAEEVLAISIDAVDSPSGEHVEAIEFDELAVTIALTRALAEEA
jgi:isoleucyl-tRNA synthetase